MTVTHLRGSYEVRFTPDVESGAEFCFVDSEVARLHPKLFVGAFVVPSGESSKCMAQFERCLDQLLMAGAGRRSTVFAVGGGVVGDLVGFVAATYLRGVSYVQVPTTLLAMVDSSVGGKVGLDLDKGKNLVGAFHQPMEVRIWTGFLATLPSRQVRNGMAEVWKYGYALDANLLDMLRTRKQGDHLDSIIHRCIQLKSDVVIEDEFDTTGRRAVLNFGHTVAHAVETLTGYGPILHGEAVAIGMVAEARIGSKLGITPAEIPSIIESDLVSEGLLTRVPSGISPKTMVDAMLRDKKSEGGKIGFSFLTGIGQCKLFAQVNAQEVEAILSE